MCAIELARIRTASGNFPPLAPDYTSAQRELSRVPEILHEEFEALSGQEQDAELS